MTGAPAAGPEVDPTRRRLYEATLSCVLDDGFRFSMEAVAVEAGVSRATVYRHFPEGRDQLVSETVAWEVGRFFTRVEREVRDAPDVVAKLERALLYGRSALEHHELLQKVLREEPERLLPELELTMPLVFAGIQGYVRSLLQGERLAPGVDLDEAAEYLARMYLTHLSSPGAWDLTDPGQVSRLVRTQFTAGVLG